MGEQVVRPLPTKQKQNLKLSLLHVRLLHTYVTRMLLYVSSYKAWTVVLAKSRCLYKAWTVVLAKSRCPYKAWTVVLAKLRCPYKAWTIVLAKSRCPYKAWTVVLALVQDDASIRLGL